MEGKKKVYDLEERTAVFGESIIAWSKMLPVNDITKRLIPQLVAAGTSVGANYCEADCAESSKDFVHKMAIANKEVKETKHFIRMVAQACPEHAPHGRVLWQEARAITIAKNKYVCYLVRLIRTIRY